MRLSKRTKPRRIDDYAGTFFRGFHVHKGERSDVGAADIAVAHLEKRYPIIFEIHRVTTDDGAIFAACLGPAATVCEGATLEVVMSRLAGYLKAEGFTSARFPVKAGIAEDDICDKPPADLSELNAVV